MFALGVLAYELVTGQRAFRGDSAAQVAQAMVAGPPAEPPLPRPIVRVLQRCLARSPFERFPDARALADALDAALRVAPVPGTRKDIGALVKELVDRLAALRDGQMSGMLSLDVGTGPKPKLEPTGEPETDAFVRPDTEVAGPTPLSGPLPMSGLTQPDLPRPMTTVTGVAPPPIPVPQGIGVPPAMPAMPAMPSLGATLPGVTRERAVATASPPPVPTASGMQIPSIIPVSPRPRSGSRR